MLGSREEGNVFKGVCVGGSHLCKQGIKGFRDLEIKVVKK